MVSFPIAVIVNFFAFCHATNVLNSVAWYYGDKVPVQQLSKFDIVVVAPDSNANPNTPTGTTQYYVYLSLGEVASFMSYYKDIPKSWILGKNDVFGSQVIDLSVPAYAEFFAVNVTGQQWNRGYRGFFLDTMDSYQIYATTHAARAKQIAGMVNIINAIKAHYPTASLIFNRGFEIMSQVHNSVFAVAFESLYATYDSDKKTYGLVDKDDQSDLLNDVKTVKNLYPSIPLISIEYCPPTPPNNTCQTSALAYVKAQGLLAYVADGLLLTVGRSS